MKHSLLSTYFLGRCLNQRSFKHTSIRRTVRLSGSKTNKTVLMNAPERGERDREIQRETKRDRERQIERERERDGETVSDPDRSSACKHISASQTLPCSLDHRSATRIGRTYFTTPSRHLSSTCFYPQKEYNLPRDFVAASLIAGAGGKADP